MMCGIFKQATMGDCLVEGEYCNAKNDYDIIHGYDEIVNI